MVAIFWLWFLPHILYCWHSALQMDCYKRRWSIYREWKIYCCVCMLSLTENLTFGNFTLPFCGLRQRIATCAARFFVLVQPIRSLFSGVVAVGAVLAYVPYSQDATVAMSLSGFKQTAILSLSQTNPRRILLLRKQISFLFKKRGKYYTCRSRL